LLSITRGISALHAHPAFIRKLNEPRFLFFPAEGGPHLPTPEGWEAELA